MRLSSLMDAPTCSAQCGALGYVAVKSENHATYSIWGKEPMLSRSQAVLHYQRSQGITLNLFFFAWHEQTLQSARLRHRSIILRAKCFFRKQSFYFRLWYGFAASVKGLQAFRRQLVQRRDFFQKGKVLKQLSKWVNVRLTERFIAHQRNHNVLLRIFIRWVHCAKLVSRRRGIVRLAKRYFMLRRGLLNFKMLHGHHYSLLRKSQLFHLRMLFRKFRSAVKRRLHAYLFARYIGFEYVLTDCMRKWHTYAIRAVEAQQFAKRKAFRQWFRQLLNGRRSRSCLSADQHFLRLCFSRFRISANQLQRRRQCVKACNARRIACVFKSWKALQVEQAASRRILLVWHAFVAKRHNQRSVSVIVRGLHSHEVLSAAWSCWRNAFQTRRARQRHRVAHVAFGFTAWIKYVECRRDKLSKKRLSDDFYCASTKKSYFLRMRILFGKRVCATNNRLTRERRYARFVLCRWRFVARRSIVHRQLLVAAGLFRSTKLLGLAFAVLSAHRVQMLLSQGVFTRAYLRRQSETTRIIFHLWQRYSERLRGIRIYQFVAFGKQTATRKACQQHTFFAAWRSVVHAKKTKVSSLRSRCSLSFLKRLDVFFCWRQVQLSSRQHRTLARGYVIRRSARLVRIYFSRWQSNASRQSVLDQYLSTALHRRRLSVSYSCICILRQYSILCIRKSESESHANRLHHNNVLRQVFQTVFNGYDFKKCCAINCAQHASKILSSKVELNSRLPNSTDSDTMPMGSVPTLSPVSCHKRHIERVLTLCVNAWRSSTARTDIQHLSLQSPFAPTKENGFSMQHFFQKHFQVNHGDRSDFTFAQS